MSTIIFLLAFSVRYPSAQPQRKKVTLRRYSDRKLLGVELSTKGLFNATDSHVFMYDGDMDI